MPLVGATSTQPGGSGDDPKRALENARGSSGESMSQMLVHRTPLGNRCRDVGGRYQRQWRAPGGAPIAEDADSMPRRAPRGWHCRLRTPVAPASSEGPQKEGHSPDDAQPNELPTQFSMPREYGDGSTQADQDDQDAGYSFENPRGLPAPRVVPLHHESQPIRSASDRSSESDRPRNRRARRRQGAGQTTIERLRPPSSNTDLGTTAHRMRQPSGPRVRMAQPNGLTDPGTCCYADHPRGRRRSCQRARSMPHQQGSSPTSTHSAPGSSAPR